MLRLGTVMNYRFSRFSGMDTTCDLWGNLDGWPAVSVGGAKGYAIRDAFPMEAKVLMLPESTSSTTVEIASRSVGLGLKGVWILSAEPNLYGKSSVVHIRTVQLL